AVKVVLDAEGYALYFSRATIPWDRDRFAKSLETVGDTCLRHLGIYGYRAGFIRRYVSWQPSQLEHIEMLEQLRVLWYGEKNSCRRRQSGARHGRRHRRRPGARAR
ncbi:3-deoxy-manno-octulosonate cytidylyltransferase, partial [Salmonella enterica subsp. enterica serovar Enteritidis str. 436]